MKGRRRSSGSASRVQFLGSERGRSHQAWYRLPADYYDHLYDPRRVPSAYLFLHDLFRRRGPVTSVLDIACGTFAVDLPLVKRGYEVVGRDLSEPMLRAARRNLREAGRSADVAHGDMRSLRLPRTFDAVLCLGTAFNYLVEPAEVRNTLATARRHLRHGGLLVLDLTNFASFLPNPKNVRAETDYRDPDGTHIAVYAFNDQDRARNVHHSRFITLVRRGNRIRLAFDESPMRIWTKADLAKVLEREGFRPVEWWGRMRLGARYAPRASPRLVSVSRRR